MSKATLVGLAAVMPAAKQQALAPLLPLLPDLLPLSYTASTDTTVWVDVATGYVIDLTQHQTITANLTGPTGAVPLTAVIDLNLNATDLSVAAQVKIATTAADGLKLIGTIIPLILGGLGVLLLILAVPLAWRRPAGKSGSAPTTPVAKAVG